MNFFKRLFGKSDKEQERDYYEESVPVRENAEALEKTVFPDADPAPELVSAAATPINGNTPERFKAELYDSLNRYYSTPELRIELNLTDAAGKVYAEHEAFEATFTEWQGIQSVWDRRSVLFEHWDRTEFAKLQQWQALERFIKDRSALDAVAYQNEHLASEDFGDIRLVVALSKLYRVLDSPPMAMRYAKAAYELRPDLDLVRVEYANVLYLTGDADNRARAQEFIDDVIETKIAASAATQIPVLNYFMFAPDWIDSSVFAVIMLKAGNADAQAWERLAEEYYWCPVFRLEHAVYLSGAGEGLRSLAKLNSLADEFPWFRAGVVATVDAIGQVRRQAGNPDMMTTEMSRLEQYQLMWES
jgi:hypothetical protein